MKTFDDLIFVPHPSGEGVQSIMNFKNGYGVCVLKKVLFHKHNNFDVALIKNNELLLDSLTIKPIYYRLEPNDITILMMKIQNI